MAYPPADFAGVAARLRQSTVQVRSGRAGSGSGVIWRPNGVIVTNAHVAHGPRASIEFWDGRVLDAEVTAIDRRRDLASLLVAASNLPAVQVGDSDQLRVGQLVLAMGNPLGLTGALTAGIVHAIAPAQPHESQTWVQADVHLAPGNSGGPLADALGRVIGVNSMVAGGLGLAVPSNAVSRFLAGTGHRPRLGVAAQAVSTVTDGRRVSGLLVFETEPGTPAETAGLIVGDILLAAAGHSLATVDDLGLALPDAGSRIRLDVLRGGTLLSMEVQIPESTERTREAA